MSPADCRLEHVFDIEVLFGADRMIFGPLPSGSSQGYTPAIGGTISGPRLSDRKSVVVGKSVVIGGRRFI